jgi:hypothetical protein
MLLLYLNPFLKNNKFAGHWYLMPVILATQEAEIRRISVQSQTRQILLEILSQNNPSQKIEIVEWLKA